MGKKKKKKAKKAKEPRTRIIPPREDMPEEDEMDDDESGVFMEKEDVQLIYNALKAYKPTEEEDNLHSVWLESFEEMLVVDYGVRLPGFEFMDEEENEKN